MDGTEPINVAGIEVPAEERTPLVDHLLRVIEELRAKKRKIRAGTQSELGRRCRDAFVSLKKTCRKLGVSFWQYLQDRIRRTHEILALPDLMRQAAQQA